MKKCFYLPSILLLLGLAAPHAIGTPAFSVTSLNDSGVGSLRAAILAANSNAGGTITFAVSGTINLSTPLPTITKPETLDGTSAPGFATSPVVSINFSGNPGLTIAKGADGSMIESLSLVGSVSAAITIQASQVAVQDNYIGLGTNGAVSANFGDGIKILSTSAANLIGNDNPVSGITYTDTSSSVNFTIQPVSAWQGLRNDVANAGQFLMCGTSDTNGLLYVGALTGGGTSFAVQYPGMTTTSTSVYGPDNLAGNQLRLVGSYKKSGDVIFNHGFVWDGTTAQLPSGGVFQTIDYPKASAQYTHSTMGGLAVGNADGPRLGAKTAAPGSGVAYIYDVTNHAFLTNIVYPRSKTTTAYGIWFNGLHGYTICGGYSPVITNNVADQTKPLTQGKAYLVDYDSSTGKFSNWTSYDYPNGPSGINFVTHFEGISSSEPGVYTLVADSVQTGSNNTLQGSWVSVRRNSDGTFSLGEWVDLNYPNSANSITSANSVYGDNVVGVVIGMNPFSYQAVVSIAFQKSNVISGNRGNGISLNGSKGTIIAMNYIGTDANGSTASTFGNSQNGILVTGGASGNLIGGQEAGANNPTGTKGNVTPVFQQPAQGNLISGNHANGVLINGASTNNIISGNFIGTDVSGTALLGNFLDGVDIESANNNSLIGCTLYQNPFVFYNVIGGNGGNGVRVNNANDITVQANFLGMGADNTALIPNGGDGLLVSGSSKNTQVGGVIPLGNVISGNTLNGIEVKDTAKGFISFNTFGGIPAFKIIAAPNGLDGILITSTGGNNTVRTCIISGNNGNGVEIGGNASGVEITDTSVGTTTDINAALPNQYNGIAISGTAHNNKIGGFQPSIEPTVFASGNIGYGIAILDSAYKNEIVHSNIGIGAGMAGAIPNQQGGIYLDQGTSGTIIGGTTAPLQNTIQFNTGDGITIISSTKNSVVNNNISSNDIGIYANGPCTGTAIKANTIQGNTTTNVDISTSTGINYQP